MGLFDFFKPKHALPPEVDDVMKKISLMAFPGGQKQIDEETFQLHALLRGKLTKDESIRLLRRTKALLIIADDKSETRITESIRASSNGKLTENEARLVYVFLTGITGPVTSGGDGSSDEQAVIINATSTIVGISEEYAYVERACGKKDVDFTLERQMHITKNERDYDVLHIIMKDGSKRGFWFDITSFFGKF